MTELFSKREGFLMKTVEAWFRNRLIGVEIYFTDEVYSLSCGIMSIKRMES